ncbi:sporulation protein [Halosimplex aquaticum]|uniref:Sporulation protein n=1 Tax=Halosimplex aquaticum TaxID=3026162 RepID=A0ABD5XXZ4_9EURY|nr:sporulation protein [Halosimplex aquaticum]
MGILSSMGIGSADVDLVLESERVTAGESLDGTVEVDGGNEAQTVDEIYGALRTAYRTDEGSYTTTITEFTLTEGFTVGAGESLTYDVAIDVPAHTPTTVFGPTEVWIDTGLDIDWAADPDDKDHISVEPPETLRTFHDAVGGLGFDLRTATTVTSTGTQFAREREFVQEFEYEPVAEAYRDDLDELEVVVDAGGDRLDVELEIDATDTLLSERETVTRLTVDEADEDALRERLREEIESSS